MASASKFKLAMQERQEFLREQRKLLEEQRAEYEADIRQLGQDLDQARHDLVGHLLPELDDASLRALEERLSCLTLLPIKQQNDEELAKIARRRDELADMEQVCDGEAMLAAVEDRMAEIAEDYTRLNQELRPWADSKWFKRLDARGYFKEGYQPTLARRFLDWRAVSFLMTDLEGKDGPTFSDSDALRAHYRKLRRDADPVIAAHDDLVQRQRHLLDIKAEYEGLLAAPEDRRAELYAALGEALLTHLNASGERMREELAAEDRELSPHFKREAGLTRQVRYLEGLMTARIEAQIESLGNRNEKLARKIEKVNNKLSRGKARFYTDEEVALMREFKADKWERRQQTLRKIRQRVATFDRHDEGTFLEGFLWWDLITDRAKADDLEEVKEFHDANPEWDHRTYRDRWMDHAVDAGEEA